MLSLVPEILSVSREQLSKSSDRIKTDLLVVSAPGAEKWKANQNPSSDRLDCVTLAEKIIGKFDSRRVIHFSTIDVYPPGSDDDEDAFLEGRLDYGGNRLLLSQMLAGEYDNFLEVRLPGLFGPGLKKNLLFDMRNERREQVEKINPESSFQYVHIQAAIKIALDAIEAGVRTLNIVAEPIQAKALPFEESTISWLSPSAQVSNYAVRTREDSTGYFFGAQETLTSISMWRSAD